MIKSDDKPLMEWASYNERFSELLMRGEPLLAHKLAWRMLSQRAQFQSQANRVLNDLYNLAHNFEIDDPKIKNLFDPCWIRKVNIAQVSGAVLDSFHTELKDALIGLGLEPDVAGVGNVDGAKRLVLSEAARARKVPIIEQLKTVVVRVARMYKAQCGAAGYPSTFLRDRFSLTHFTHGTRNGGYHSAYIHKNAMFVVAYYVDVPMESEAEIVLGGFGRVGLPNLTAPPVATWRPVTGDFIVFPGFHSHMTTPHQGPELRINMAFDVQPV